MSVTFIRRADVTDPDDLLAWPNTDGTLRDLTEATLILEIIDPTTNVIEYTKTTGVIGDDGTNPSNVAIAWTSGEMTPLAGPKRWKGRLLSNSGSERAEFVLDNLNTLPVWVFQPVPTDSP
jgi:hypothetical protein